MTEADEATRQKRIKILQALFAKTKENGCSEEEAASASAHAAKLMDDWAIEDHELGVYTGRKTFFSRKLNTKYSNKWRWETANTIAHNTGVLAVYRKPNPHREDPTEHILFHGREQPVEAAALLAEYVISTVEQLSAEFAKESGTGMTGKRRFARGCSMRLRDRIRRSSDLTADPRLPAIMAEAREEAMEDYGDLNEKRKRNSENMTPEFLAGWKKGDHVKLRKETEQIA